MKLKRTDGKRRLVVEHLERRELLAADLSCPMVMLPQGPGGDNAAIVQNQVSMVADGTADTVLQRREQSEANSGIGALQRPRARDSQDSDTELTFLAAASVPADVPPEEQVRVNDSREDDSDMDVGREKRPRDRDSEDDTTSTLLEGSAVDATFQTDALAATGNGGTQENAANSLSEDEILKLLFIREEEKMARDVYITLGEQWGLPIFANIAASEQQHMDAIGQLIEKYDLKDPVTDDAVGVFTDPNLQELYGQLVSDGAGSALAALEVGAFIEEYDILDIQDALDDTIPSDVENVYENLLRGSRNHLRSFVAQIEATSGEIYVPVLMTIDMYQEIIDGDQETANGNRRGGQRAQVTIETFQPTSGTTCLAHDKFFAKLGRGGGGRRS